jgi:NAD(P)-dependent dehydrogenase (short-subunit alcohol dehydrogenase family)
MDVRFDNKVCVVTGSARGIGYAIADLLLDSGAKVAMVDILADRLAESAHTLSAKGVAKAYPQDLTKVQELGPLVEKIRAEMGEIDVLIQAAAVGPQVYAEDITEEQWDDVFAVNAKGLFFLMREVVGQSMVPRHKGSVVNFSSIAGLVGMRKPLCSALYAGSKGAVAALTLQGAAEWAEHQVRVNAVASGGVLTEMTMSLIGDDLDKATALVPLGRLSQPEEIAAAVLFYASDLAANITGQFFVVDGGGYGMQADPGYLTPAQIAAYARGVTTV